MKKIIVILLGIFVMLLGRAVEADEVSSRILSYDANLLLQSDNSGVLTQDITFLYSSDFNGQYITLGTEQMPKGFDVDKGYLNYVKQNGKMRSDAYGDLEKIDGGYRIKVYDGGHSGDKVKVKVTWHLKAMTTAYQDVAELNWKPISDPDETLEKVTYTVKTEKQTANQQLWAHRGYFKKAPKVSRLTNGYKVEAEDVDGALELHGYWDSDIFDNSVARLKRDGKQKILRTEKLIDLKSAILGTLFGRVIPVSLLVLGVLAAMLSKRFSRRIDPFNPKGIKARLYEIPEDLSPLVLAMEIYRTNLKGLLLDGDFKSDHIRFNHLIQAVLVDLIDRKHLSVEDDKGVPVLRIINLGGLTKYESTFLKMAFGRDEQRRSDELFSDYQYDEKAVIRQLKKSYKGTSLQSAVRKSGDKMRHNISQMVQAIDKSVNGEILGSKRPKIYRKLRTDEVQKISRMKYGLMILVIVSILALFYMLLSGSSLVLLYVGLTVLLIVLSWVSFRQFKPLDFPGVVTEKGANRLLQWQSFERMLKTLDTFDDTDLQGVVLWNRMLVYANLLGYADKVEDYVKLHQITLPPSLAAVNLRAFRNNTYYSGRHLSYVSSSAMSASNFSISSGSSSGSGGFSGGGGGGGVGSF